MSGSEAGGWRPDTIPASICAWPSRSNATSPSATASAGSRPRQIDKALAELGGERYDDLRKVVHSVRKRGKRFRALLRLVRPELGKEYHRANEAVRDAGRALAPIREAHALLGTFDALVAGSGPDRVDHGLLGVRAGLAQGAREATARIGTDDPVVEEAKALLGSIRDGVDDWAIGDGFSALAPGLEATYRRGRDGLRSVVLEPSAEALHEWRKGAKHLWHQTQLLAPSAPSALGPAEVSLHALADTLGDDHDLVGLVDLLRADPDSFGGCEVEAAVDLADRRRADLEERALALGARLYAEKPKAFVDRAARYWDIWQTYGDELPAGEIGTIAPPDDGLEDRMRSELYDLARAADIVGRSAMDRDDLIASLRAFRH